MRDSETGLLEVNLIAYALAAAGEDGLTELLDLLSHDDFSVHTYAAEGLGALDNRARWAVPALIGALSSPVTDWTAHIIVRALGNIGGRRAIDHLQRLAALERARQAPNIVLLEVIESALAAAITQPE